MSANKPLALVVEDETMVRLLAVDMLEELGWSAQEAATVSEATAILAQNLAFAVALIDMGLPDRPGLELAKDLRRNSPQLPLIIASGQDIGELKAAFDGDSGVVILPKPYAPKALVAALAKLGIAGS